MNVRLVKITEGKTKLFVPDLLFYKKPGNAPVFYNPAMEKERNNAVQILRIYLKKKAKVADILCGTGARAVRYANECGLITYANDISPTAIEVTRKNAKENSVTVRTSILEANEFLRKHKKKFDAIDIDPFGSPLKFLKNAGDSLRKRGLLCITATDIGTLDGYFPKKCIERYGIITAQNSFPSELGIRNLLFIIQKKTKKTLDPIGLFANAHYLRVYVKCDLGKKYVGYIAYCECERRKICSSPKSQKCKCGKKMKIFGPTWIGKIQGTEIPYYDIHVLASKYKKKCPSIDQLIEKLKAFGYLAERSMFCGYGLKTNAPFEKILEHFS